MRNVINQSTIWKIVGCVSAMSGLVCFALGSTYKKSFGKLGIGGLFVYLSICLLICSIMSCPIIWTKRIRVSGKVQGVVVVVIFNVIIVISVVHDKLVDGKSDAPSIISYGLFSLMSVSVSRKLELGIETGLSAFFLQLFAAQLFKIKWFLLPIALVFCSIIIILRHCYPESGVQSGSITPNGYHPVGVGLLNATERVVDIPSEDSNVQSQDSPSNEEVSGQSLLSRNKQQNNEEETSSSSPAKSSGNDGVTIQNGRMHSSDEPELISRGPPGELRSLLYNMCMHDRANTDLQLMSHLSSLTLEECELSAELEAELTVSTVSKEHLTASEDQISLKHTLAAVRSEAQAAARIQSAFRAHSFRKRREREAAISAAAAISIQKKYRGWKGLTDFLALRKKVVKIQAHVRGYQTRKHYRLICWSVELLDKVVLRWRRKGTGLRGFQQERNSIDEDEDFLKVFRKQKVNEAVEQAVSRVLSMVDSANASQQYHRLLEKFRQAKKLKEA